MLLLCLPICLSVYSIKSELIFSVFLKYYTLYIFGLFVCVCSFSSFIIKSILSACVFVYVWFFFQFCQKSPSHCRFLSCLFCRLNFIALLHLMSFKNNLASYFMFKVNFIVVNLKNCAKSLHC